ncbi:MAG: pilus assembly protein TadG-related protein, partial [Aestuariivirga sp.]
MHRPDSCFCRQVYDQIRCFAAAIGSRDFLISECNLKNSKNYEFSLREHSSIGVTMSVWSRFRFGNRGNVAFVFAVSIVPLLLAMGAAIDLIRANQAKDALQGAADAAALAAGASDRT